MHWLHHHSHHHLGRHHAPAAPTQEERQGQEQEGNSGVYRGREDLGLGHVSCKWNKSKPLRKDQHEEHEPAVREYQKHATSGITRISLL